MDLERRLTRAGQLLDLAAEGHAPVHPARPQRPGRRIITRAAAAVLILVAVIGATIAGWPNEDAAEVGTRPAASVPAEADFVTITVTAQVEPAEAAAVEVIDPRFDSLPATGNYQISITLASQWSVEADVTTGPWESSPFIVVGNQETGCSTDQAICNVGASGLIRHDVGNIVPLFVDASTLPLGDVTLQTIVRSARGEQVALTVTLTVSKAEPPPLHTELTTTTTEP